MTHPAIPLGLILAGALAAPPARADRPDGPPPIDLRDGDRVVLVGDALIERMQHFGSLEALLTASLPDRAVTFRNLGWSGDTVFGEARAGFGTPDDGFKALVAQVEATRPTVLIVGYGANESWDGEAGLPRFRAGLERLLEALEATGARAIVLLSPIARRPAPSPAPDAGHDEDLARYAAEIERVAERRGHRFVDLLAITRPMAADDAPGSPRWYDPPGIHLAEPGDEALARHLARRLFGIAGPPPIDAEHLEALRRAIVAKNRLYFHRYRPQNETYLFGFRRHEQGTNAAEVERFDRLVSEAEAEIARLKMPESPVLAPGRFDEEDADR